MGGFSSGNRDYKTQSNGSFDTSIKTTNYVSSSVENVNKNTSTTNTEIVDLNDDSKSVKRSSVKPSSINIYNTKVWKTYEDAVADGYGYENILTKHEFLRRKAAGGLEYDSYESYLKEMYDKYKYVRKYDKEETEGSDTDSTSHNSTDSDTSNITEWKSYEDAVASGYANILTKQEFLRRKAVGGIEYDSYDDYLNKMYNRYINKDFELESSIDSNSVENVEDILKNMSKEDYDQYIKELKDSYDNDISEYEKALEKVEKILSEMNTFRGNELYAHASLDEDSNALIGKKSRNTGSIK